MKTTWIVVGNAARARVLEEAQVLQPAPQRQPHYTHVADLVHPASRQHGVDLADDRPGQVRGTGHGLGSAAYNPRTDPREREHDRFAREVAQFLDHGIAAGRCQALVLVAGAPFLGALKSHLGTQATKAVQRTLARDFTTLDDEALAEELGPAPGP